MCYFFSDEDEAFLAEDDNVFFVVEHGPFLSISFSFYPSFSGSMASLYVGASPLINESWVFIGSSLKLRIGFRNKRFRRVSEVRG